VFYFDAGNALYIGGTRWLYLRDSSLFFMTFALLALLFITVINIVGLRFGRWLHNLGAVGMWLPALIVIVMGGVAWVNFGSATHFTAQSFVPVFDSQHMIVWSTIAFALSGAETASFMSGEIKDPRRTIPRALPIAGVVIVTSYIVGTFAVLLAMPSGEVNTLQGLIQAGAVAARSIQLPSADGLSSPPCSRTLRPWTTPRPFLFA
jgi:amino acid transporter